MSDLHAEEQPLLSSSASSSFSHSGSEPSEKHDQYRASIRIFGCCISAAAAGWHDGCIGALIPYLQIYYGVTDKQVSLVFIGSFTGYVLASLLNVPLTKRLGLGRLVVLGAVIQGLASLSIALRPPFIAMAICCGLAGFGISLQDAQYNTYLARLPNASTKLGIVHATYGVGALLSPIAATLLMQSHIPVPPPLFYFTNLAWCAASMTALLTGFGFSSKSSPDSETQFQPAEQQENEQRTASLRTVISTRSVWTALLFISLYTGAETTEAGWSVSFLMRSRHGGTLSGYVSAAFYAGLTSSRILLLPLTALLTEMRAVPTYVIVGLAMQILIWASPSLIVAFVAIAATGFVMGPIYPITVSLVTKATPHAYHPGALSLMACVSQSGSALFPFVVGALADGYGIGVLQPVMVVIFGSMLLIWSIVPGPRRIEKECQEDEEDRAIDPDRDGT